MCALVTGVHTCALPISSTALAYWDGYPVMLLWGMASISNLGTGVSPSGQNRAAALTGADGHHTPVIGRSVASCKQADCLPLNHARHRGGFYRTGGGAGCSGL